MSDQRNVVESLIGNTTEYVETRVNLLKLKLVDKTSNVASTILTMLPRAIIFLLVFFLLNIGIALLIGDLVGKAYLGFLILTGFYLITGLVLYAGRNKFFKAPIANMIISKILKNTSI